ncbi:MAG: hormogonium polysaccharide biosynthesis protein HpsL [Cyanobacteria bacterium P01_D01_bin.115]
MPKTKAPVKSRKKAAATASEAEPILSRKEQRKLERARAQNRQAVIQSLAIVLGIATVLAAIASFVLEPKLGVAAGLAIACLGLSYRFPRFAIYGFIFYLPLSGTVTYALGGSPILQLAKDAIFFPALLRVILFCKEYNQRLIFPQAMRIPFIIFMTYCTAVLLFVNGAQQISAQGEMPIPLGILGLKALVGYLLLITCIHYLIRTKADLYFLLRTQVVFIIICCGLGFVQYLMLTTGICPPTQGTGDALFKASLESRCLVGGALLYSPQFGVIRLPGTFVAPWQWGWFLISSTFFAFGTAFNDRSLIWRTVGIFSMVMVGVMAVVSGQRIALALVPASTILLLLMTGQLLKPKRFLPIGIGLALILVFLAQQYPDVLNDSFQSLVGRWNAAPPTDFITHQLQWSIDQQRGFLGRGLGRATNAARIFGKVSLVETYHSKVLFEIAPLGLVLLLSLFTVLVITSFKAYRSLKDPSLRGYGASMFTFVLFISYFPYYYPLDVDPVNVYYWLAAGIALKLPDLDRQERMKGGLGKKLSKKELKQLKKSQQAIEFR